MPNAYILYTSTDRLVAPKSCPHFCPVEETDFGWEFCLGSRNVEVGKPGGDPL